MLNVDGKKKNEREEERRKFGKVSKIAVNGDGNLLFGRIGGMVHLIAIAVV